MLKSRDITLLRRIHIVKAMFFSSSYVWMWELNNKEGLVLNNWCFGTTVLEKSLENPLSIKEIQLVLSHKRVFHFYNKPLSVKSEFMPLGILDSLRVRLVYRKTEWLEGRNFQPHPWFQGREESWFVVIVAIVQSLCLILCNHMDCSMPAKFPMEFAQSHVHWVGDAIQTSHPLSPPSFPAL